jgi:hypothetical protein
MTIRKKPMIKNLLLSILLFSISNCHNFTKISASQTYKITQSQSLQCIRIGPLHREQIISNISKLITDVNELRKFRNVVEWKAINYTLINSIELLREFRDVLDWDMINYALIKSIEHFREFIDVIIWKRIDSLMLYNYDVKIIYKLINSIELFLEFKNLIDYNYVNFKNFNSTESLIQLSSNCIKK